MATEIREASAAERVEAARAFAVEAARLAANTRCHDVVVLDLRKISPVTDFFVIASGTSPRQMRTVGDEIQELAEPRGYTALTRSGYDGEQWMLYDFVDVIVHVFNDESRRFYDLENLWGDAPRVDWRDGQAPPPHQQ